MKPLSSLLAVSLLGGTAAAQATFTSVPSPSVGFTGASKDGTFHSGPSFNADEAFVWSSGGGLTTIATPGNSSDVDVTDDGLTIAGTFDNGGNDEAAFITGGVTTFIGGLASQSGNSVSSMYAMNTDGSVIVGLGWVTAGQAHAFKWVSGVMNDLGSLNPTRSSRANNVSDDGNVVVGWDEHSTGFRRPAYWTGSVETLMVDDSGEAWAVNHDGSVIAGTWNGDCFRWDAVNGMSNLGKLPASLPADDVFGLSVSDDGKTIVGFNGNAFFGTPFRAFIWREGAGMVVLEDLLVALGASGAAGANLSFANTVSADGRTISGTAGAFPFPNSSWVATLPEVATIYCTAKVNSAGCTPAIAFEGTPSASSGSGFVISADQIMFNTSGLLIYSKDGPDALPFFGGTLCLAGQVKRTPGQNSAGTGPGCTGSLSMDFNVYVANGPDAGLVGGTTVWAQYWSRDQGFPPPNNANTTDAVEFTLWP